ncbi:putative dihydrofolate reductase [Phaeomoniella chlamydospora]|uniref:Putative dihydrofolate reductase n=1 Tax=Phaeomoniella chlamydospora TaxID=158046 RepID=A0A0G2E5U0_PHACM|nr:putative dihydrofolate reductase [Phaeomoniella chlamydospora]
MSQPTSPLKILMLHGYTQSGEIFHGKTRALEKHLVKAFPGSKLVYPTGPLRLRPSDIPGFDAAKFQTNDDDDVESFAWWRRADDSDPVEYKGFDEGAATIANVLATEGPFDGVIGFSQGASAAAMVASLLEGPQRRKSFEDFHAGNPLCIPYPDSFTKLDHPPLKFCIPYSGFAAPGIRYQAFYNPPIATPTCHFLGSLDTLVDEARGRTLVDGCGGEAKTQVLFHPGGHIVNCSRPFLNAAAEFIRNCVTEEKNETKEEERAEDMDVPF